jgi:hypothetical protein
MIWLETKSKSALKVDVTENMAIVYISINHLKKPNPIKCNFVNSIIHQPIAVDLKFMFYLPYPGHLNQKENAYTDKDIEISFTKFVKAKDTRLKNLASSKQVGNDASFSFYYQTHVNERHIAVSIDSKYFKYLTTKELDEKRILSFVETCLHPDTHTAKLIQLEIKKMVDHERLQCPNKEYIDN